ncbi:hypothetical protein ALC53_07996, partial [Atta colombica]
CSCVVYSSSDRPQGGTFTSPDFPKRYPPNIDCLLYTFIGHPDEIVVLTFHQFNIRRIWPEAICHAPNSGLPLSGRVYSRLSTANGIRPRSKIVLEGISSEISLRMVVY